MKSRRPFIWLKSVTVIWVLFIAMAGGQASAGDFVAREVLVKFKQPTSLAEARQLLDGADFEVQRASYARLRIFLVRIISPGLSEPEAVDTLRTLSFVEQAYLNYVFEPCFIPNDDLFPDQWNLSQSPDSGDIRAPGAWELATGGENLYGGNAVVAIIDIGFNRDHRELQDRQWINMAEDTGLVGVDDDSNGVIDDIRGYRAYAEHDTAGWNEGIPRFCPYYDDEGQDSWYGFHGTAVAGLVSAESNNDTLVSAPNWGCKLLLISTCVLTWDWFSESVEPADSVWTLSSCRRQGFFVYLYGLSREQDVVFPGCGSFVTNDFLCFCSTTRTRHIMDSALYTGT